MAKIGSINDLTDLGNGIYQKTYSGGQRGFVTSDNAVLSQLWYARAKYALGLNWKWGTTPYEGTDHSFANDKIIRFWNPGSTKENCYVELTGYEGSNGIAKFVIEDSNGVQIFQKYFWDGFKGVLVGGSEHTLEFEFKDSDANTSNGTFKMWVDGVQVCDIQGFKSKTSGGAKRVYILGMENEWGSGASNTLTLSNPVLAEGKTRDQYMAGSGGQVPAPPVPPPPPVPLPTPTPTPVPAPSYPTDFKTWWNSRPAALKGDL